MTELNLTPQQIVKELDKHIIGQKRAKRAVAIALRNRQRRRKLPPELRAEIRPKNILMIGPTGVGKTEIARRLARLVSAPFIKVEVTKFTEVGYVGRDVESMIKDLVETAVHMVKEEKTAAVQEKAANNAEDRLIRILAGIEKPGRSRLNPLPGLIWQRSGSGSAGVNWKRRWSRLRWRNRPRPWSAFLARAVWKKSARGCRIFSVR